MRRGCNRTYAALHRAQAEAVLALDDHVTQLQGMPNSEASRAMSDTQEEVRAEKLAVGEARQAAARERRDSALVLAEEARAELDVPERDAGAAYFVLFGTLVAAATARQVFQAAAVRGLVTAAPPPEEVNWAVLQPAVRARVRFQQPVARAAFVAMLLWFSIPVTIVSALIALESLEGQSRGPSNPLTLLPPTYLPAYLPTFLPAFLPALLRQGALPSHDALLAGPHSPQPARRLPAQVRGTAWHSMAQHGTAHSGHTVRSICTHCTHSEHNHLAAPLPCPAWHFSSSWHFSQRSAPSLLRCTATRASPSSNCAP